jgi:hypothetical protein
LGERGRCRGRAEHQQEPQARHRNLRSG